MDAVMHFHNFENNPERGMQIRFNHKAPNGQLS